MFLRFCRPSSRKVRSSLPLDLIQHLARNADAAAIGDAFEPGRDIDPVAENVGAVCDDFAEIDADAEFYAPVRWHLRISLEHTSLNRDARS